MKFGDVKLQLISNKEIYQFVEETKKGGVSSVSTRFSCTRQGFEEIKKIDREFTESFKIPAEEFPESILYIG